MPQVVRFCRAHDGVRLAYATSGEGPALVKAANWLTHLRADRESVVLGRPDYRCCRQRSQRVHDKPSSGCDDRAAQFTAEQHAANEVRQADADRHPIPPSMPDSRAVRVRRKAIPPSARPGDLLVTVEVIGVRRCRSI